ncbi:MFS transporter [Candidatus Woesearchaeota archaeon]|nr:MFS transporter [Candidatus Woesearchaeota archaeon]
MIAQRFLFMARKQNTEKTSKPATLGGVSFYHPFAFWLGVVLVTGGVAAHLPMYWMARDIGFKMVGMPMDDTMIAGMVAIVIGMIASLYGLYPRQGAEKASAAARIRISTMDDARLNMTHVSLLLAMALAVTIDIMKPTSLAFVMPGMTVEYGLKSPLNPTGSMPAVWVALTGITGTVLGSFVWGWLGDIIGRRASILYAGIGFIATSICGAMPSFEGNLVMCFIMGLAVGGMLPICYALLAETIPARHRGWLMILVGADIAGAYILTSWLSAELVPVYSWRILWLIGMPTGVLFILMNRWIPESPRFLLVHGHEDEAYAVMGRYGASIIKLPEEAPVQTQDKGKWQQLFTRENLGFTLLVGTLAIGSGLVMFGFNLWIPTNLRKMGFAEADAILRNAALMGFPLTFVIAWMYGFWSSKKTIIILGLLTAIALFGFVAAGDAIAQNRTLLYALLIVPIWGISSVVAVLSVYSSEIYTTRIRARGTGFAAGASKAGGVLVIALVSFGMATPSITTVALIGAIPMTLAVILVALFGVETCKRRLEDIVPDQRMKATT